MKHPLVRLDERHRFDEIIDVRTPLEFEHDHIPGAINAPVLSNEERVVIGTLYKQVSAFEATRLGAAMVARNIAAHLDTLFADRPRAWRPLIYCWRGGKRSGSMTAWFNLIGWKAGQLEGGYKAYRHWVLEQLETGPARVRYIVIGGATGSGKTRLLNAMARAGAQVLDLEGLARHRGSLLGALPGERQPSQKAFETGLVGELARFDPDRPVFVEAESRMIGNLRLPETLLARLHESPCLQLRADTGKRIDFLCRDYAHLFDTPEAFKEKLGYLAPLHGRKTIETWQAMVDARSMPELFRELVERHYDPAYRKSGNQHFCRMGDAPEVGFDPTDADPDAAARAILARFA
ncbi:tRNA 2-selenouridine(34) synthase MnmH [Paludibacterium paludis]|uniref:tRNA 2-selenouridine synthase n=1 Tax=Paludibacterium paludis TaxID=1225769 RepID=A0A918UBX4_9NEIS|nr:tRNA 2-selenouridine(34) synthase MnmH [Paludibacterium paludis]GGY28232.1 tRNA 2-selenouridine synthase [Paludibacterium paludis]